MMKRGGLLLLFLEVFFSLRTYAEGTLTVDSDSVSVQHSLNEVVVTGTRNETDIRHLPMTISIINREVVEERHAPYLLPVITSEVPGFFSTSRGIMGYGVSGGSAGSMSIRGISSSSGGLMVLIDGHPQYMGIMGHPVADAYQSPMAERVEVLRGPASALYGSNAMGGVVNIVTKQLKDDGVETDIDAGYGSFNTFQSGISNSVRKGRFSSTVNGTYNRTDGHRRDMGFEQYGGYVKLGCDISDKWGLGGDANVTHFNASNPGEIDDPLIDAKQHVTRGMASLFLKNEYKRSSGNISVFYNWGHHKINDGYTTDPNDDDEAKDYLYYSNDNMFGVSAFQNLRFFEGNNITLGVDYFRFGGKAWNAYFNGTERSLTDKTENEIAGYVGVRQTLLRFMTIDAAVRIDHHSSAGTEWIPQAGVSFNMRRDMLLKFMASRGFRFPTIKEMYMFASANPDLKAESLWNYEISFSQSLPDAGISYGVNLFYIDGRNMIYTNMINGRPKNVNSGAIDNAGVESQIKYVINRNWSVNANYSFLHMENPVLAAPQHKLHVGASFNMGRWSASSTIDYINGLYTKTGTNAMTESFVLWNIYGSFKAAKWIDIWVKGENLLAQRYEIIAGFPMPKATFMGGFNINI